MKGLDPSRGIPPVWLPPKEGESILIRQQETPMIQKRAWGWTIGFGATILGLIIWLMTKAWVIIQRF